MCMPLWLPLEQDQGHFPPALKASSSPTAIAPSPAPHAGNHCCGFRHLHGLSFSQNFVSRASTAWPLLSGRFYLAACFLRSGAVIAWLGGSLSLFFNCWTVFNCMNITIVYLPLIDIWVLSGVWGSCMRQLWTFSFKALVHKRFLFFWVNTQKWNCWVTGESVCFNVCVCQIILHSVPGHLGIPLALHAHLYLALSVFGITVVPVSVRWCLSVHNPSFASPWRLMLLAPNLCAY